MRLSLLLRGNSVHGHGKRNDYYETPLWFFNILNNRFNFTVDAAALKSNTKCERFFNDGLTESWRDERVFCNPPFSKKKYWMEKAHNEVQNNNCSICVMLLPTNSMSSSFWHDYVFGKYYYEILNKRLFFIDPKTKEPAKEADSGLTVVYFMKKLPSKNTGE